MSRNNSPRLLEKPGISPTPARARSDLTGKVFGKLTVLGFYGCAEKGQYKWVCSCECGKFSTPYGFLLTAGKSTSCGCIAAEKSAKRWKEGGDKVEKLREFLSKAAKNATHRQSKNPLYRVWTDMKQRCLNTKSKWYPYYGGRGITICESWMDFETFLNDMQPGYCKGLSLGRKDNDKGYSKDNCRWETASQQQRNKSNTRVIVVEGKKVALQELAEQHNLTVDCIAYRLSAGWSLDKTLNTESQRGNNA